MPEPVIRAAKTADIDAASDLVIRLKRLNGEFDPMFTVEDNAHEIAKEYLREAMGDDSRVVLVAELKNKIVGVLKADLRDRRFYKPRKEGAIVDFYILPEFRRKRLGEELLERGSKKLKEKGAQIITAEFPSQNKIAVSFYEKRGFRPLVSLYATKTV